MLKMDYITIQRKKLQRNKANNNIIIKFFRIQNYNYEQRLFGINTILILTVLLCKNLYQ